MLSHALGILHVQRILFGRSLRREIKENSYKIAGKLYANTVPALQEPIFSYKTAKNKFFKQLQPDFPDHQHKKKEKVNKEMASICKFAKQELEECLQ